VLLQLLGVLPIRGLSYDRNSFFLQSLTWGQHTNSHLFCSSHRRLSKREQLQERQGVINEGFEMDPPKSPWRYPFSRSMAVGSRVPVRMGGGLSRTPCRVGVRDFNRSTSQDSQSSSCTGSSGASSLGLSFLHKETLPPVHSDPPVSACRSVSRTD
jgi:hypothetical protein